MEKPIAIDFSAGVLIADVREGAMIQGKVGEEDVVLVRSGGEFFAVGATCPHYGGPLAQGLAVRDEIRCPLHHSCFSLRTGEVLRAPAFDAIPCWRVERVGDRLFVREKLPVSKRTSLSSKSHPSSVVVLGGGAAGFAAADTLRREGYDGPLTMITADEFAPYDRPNLSKEYLTGQAPEEWMPLRPADYYSDRRIDLVLNARASAIDVGRRLVELEDRRSYKFDALLLATGADPVRIAVPGASDSQLYYLRSFRDAKDLIAKSTTAKHVIVVGASFIGLEIAASLRERGVAVEVVAPDSVPLGRVLGDEIGQFIRTLHESHGVVFHLGETVARVDGKKVSLSGGATVEADFLVLGVGVRPSIALAEKAGLKVDRGVVVNEYLETSAPAIFAAGDIARWPDPRSGQSVRIEHWVVAELQGQVAARNILGRNERFDAVPFFWTSQYGVSVKYIGHAEKWDTAELDGSLEAKDCAVKYNLQGRTLAVATIGRDFANLQVEASMESEIVKHDGLHTPEGIRKTA